MAVTPTNLSPLHASPLQTLPPLALYVHFPWCVRKCPYCDFNSHTLHGELPQQKYLDALVRDLEIQSANLFASLDSRLSRPISSVFLGGGTPSLFAPEALGRLFTALRQCVPWASDAEITLEANPGTIERGRFVDYRAAGINRVSLGAQSFSPQLLERLGRIHSAQDTRVAVEELRAAGIDNFNLDLMYALPGQDLGGALADLRAALELAPAHLSHYQLTMEPGTVFGGKPPAGLPDDELSFQMQQACQAELALAGYAQYEVSAYARAGARCTHNLNYWNFGDYLGVGAGAHGKITRGTVASARIVAITRTVREREPRRYLAAGFEGLPATVEVPHRDRPYEYMLNALRLVEGFEEVQFVARTGLPWDAVAPQVLKIAERGLLERVPNGINGWRPTDLGSRFLNDAIAEFLPTGSAV